MVKELEIRNQIRSVPGKYCYKALIYHVETNELVATLMVEYNDKVECEEKIEKWLEQYPLCKRKEGKEGRELGLNPRWMSGGLD